MRLPQTINRRVTSNRQAFSLMEVIFVLALTGIIMAMGAPRYMRSVDRYRANAAARRIAADLSYAQAQARTTGASQTLTFNTASLSYQMPNTKDLKGRTGTYLVSLSAEPYRAAALNVDWSGSRTISFDAYGQPSQEGTITVTAGATTSAVRLGAPAALASGASSSSTTTSSGGITIQLGGLGINLGL